MKILQITPSYKPAYVYGGTTVSVSQLCEALVGMGNEVTVLTTTANGTTELPLHDQQPTIVEGVKVYYFSRYTKDHTHFSPALLWFLFRHLRQYDIIHIQSWWNLVAVFAVAVCALRGIKPILSPRGMLSAYSFVYENSLKKRLIHWLLGKKLLSKTILHATATAELAEAKQLIPDWQGFVLPNILPLPTVVTLPLTLPYSKQKTFRLLFLSRIDHKKGLELFFEVLAATKEKLASQQIDIQLLIIGGGEQTYIQSLKKLVKDLYLTDQIHWLGRVDGEQKYGYYAQADVFVLPSYNENFANVVLESLSQGTAVWLSSFVGLAAYVQQHNLGVVTDLEKTAMQESLLKLLLDETQRQKIRNTAPQQIAKDFDQHHLTTQYLEQYEHFNLVIPRYEG